MSAACKKSKSLSGPCANCPFRSDKSGFISPERGEEIWESLERGGEFPCHKTVDYSNDSDGVVGAESKFCAGALILMEHEWEGQGGAMANQMVRIASRVGLLDLDALDMKAPVFDEASEWLEHLEASQ